MTKTQKIILISVFSAIVIAVSTYLLIRKKGKGVVDKMKNYVIGDSQTPYIDKNSSKVSRISETSGESSLWKGGMGLTWLKESVEKYPESPDVNSIVINIGTNGGFNANEDIQGLVSAIKKKFPNADLYAVQGSWGWGYNKGITQEKVNKYYDKFNQLGVKIINPPIGNVSDPHSNLPIYAEIGKALDSAI